MKKITVEILCRGEEIADNIMEYLKEDFGDEVGENNIVSDDFVVERVKGEISDGLVYGLKEVFLGWKGWKVDSKVINVEDIEDD